MNSLFKKLLRSALLLGLLIASFSISEVSYAAKYDTSVCEGLEMGQRTACHIRVEVLNATANADGIFNVMYLVLFALIAYSIIRTMLTIDPTKWALEFISLGGRFAFVMVIAFPNKYGLPNIPYEIYTEVEKFSMGLVTGDVVGSGSGENDGFGTIVSSMMQLGENFWGRNNLVNGSGLPIACGVDDMVLFTKQNVGEDIAVPIDAQTDCLWQRLRETAEVGDPEASGFNRLKQLIEQNFGYGGMNAETAQSILAKIDDPKTSLSDKPSAAVKLGLIKFLREYEAMVEELAHLNYVAEVSKGDGVVDNLKQVGAKLETYLNRVSYSLKPDRLMDNIGMGAIYLAIGVALLFIGVAYFMISLLPSVVVPIGIMIFQMMFITAVLPGVWKSLMSTYKNTILPFAIGPAVFTFLSFFVLAMIKAMIAATAFVDAALPPLFIQFAIAFIIGALGYYAYKLMSKSFEWAKSFLSLSLQPLLDFAMKTFNVFGELIAGAIKMAGIGITGGAAAGAMIAGTGTAASSVSATGGTNLSAVRAGLRSVAGGEAGGIGAMGGKNAKNKLTPGDALAAYQNLAGKKRLKQVSSGDRSANSGSAEGGDSSSIGLTSPSGTNTPGRSFERPASTLELISQLDSTQNARLEIQKEHPLDAMKNRQNELLSKSKYMTLTGSEANELEQTKSKIATHSELERREGEIKEKINRNISIEKDTIKGGVREGILESLPEILALLKAGGIGAGVGLARGLSASAAEQESGNNSMLRHPDDVNKLFDDFSSEGKLNPKSKEKKPSDSKVLKYGMGALRMFTDPLSEMMPSANIAGEVNKLESSAGNARNVYDGKVAENAKKWAAYRNISERDKKIDQKIETSEEFKETLREVEESLTSETQNSGPGDIKAMIKTKSAELNVKIRKRQELLSRINSPEWKESYKLDPASLETDLFAFSEADMQVRLDRKVIEKLKKLAKNSNPTF